MCTDEGKRDVQKCLTDNGEFFPKNQQKLKMEMIFKFPNPKNGKRYKLQQTKA